MNQSIRTLVLPCFLVATVVLNIGAFSAAAFAPAAVCPTGAGGVISSDQTWSADCTFPNSDVTVSAGATLTISPGVDVGIDNPNHDLIVSGTLLAQGTVANPIRFTSGDAIPSKGDWGQIIFNASSVNNVLEYLIVEYGGAGISVRERSLDIRTSSITVENSTVRNSAQDGIRITDASPDISDTTITNNDGRALDLHGASFPQLSNLTATGNLYNGVAINGTTVTADYTWGAGISDYWVTDDLTVNAGATLTVLPGTTVRVTNPNTDLDVNGTLLAQGTVSDTIRFTSGDAVPSKGDWGQLRFNPSSTDSVLDYVTVEYGGAGIAVRNTSLDIRSSSLAVNNSAIQNANEDGIRITDASPTISNTTIANNSERALDLYGASFPQLSNLTASGNEFDGVVINGTTVSSDYAWGAGINSYWLTADVTVNDSATLSVLPGTTVKVTNPNTDLFVDGTLEAQGTAAKSILFTSGDTTPSRGDWGWIYFNPSSSGSLLEYVTVEYAKGVRIASSSVTLENSTITRSDSDGIRVTAGAPTITRNNIVDNSGYGLRNTGDGGVVIAACNWWGAASGPTHSTNPDGSGQTVSDGVVYDPWLVAPAPGGACSGTNPRILLPVVVR